MKRVRRAALLCLALAGGCWRETRPTAESASRVVSLAPNITEIICAIGAESVLVGRSSACDYPPEIVARVPVAGDFGRPAMERLLALRPTLVLAADLEDKTLPEQLRRFGVPLEVVPCRSLDDITLAIRRVGRLTGRSESAEILAARFDRDLQELRRQAGAVTEPPTVYAELWHDPPLTIGGASFISEIIRLAGGRNLGDVVSREYFEVSPEWVLAADPDVILNLGMGKAGDFEAVLLARPGFDHLRAVKNRRIIADVPADLLLRPGPRSLEAVRELRRRLAAVRTKTVP